MVDRTDRFSDRVNRDKRGRNRAVERHYIIESLRFLLFTLQKSLQ